MVYDPWSLEWWSLQFAEQQFALPVVWSHFVLVKFNKEKAHAEHLQ